MGKLSESSMLFWKAAVTVVISVCICGAAYAQNGSIINEDTTPPTVTSVTSSTANGTYKIGQTIVVQVVFSEIVSYTAGTGWAQIQLETGSSDALVAYTSGSGSTTLVFNYTIAEGDLNPDLDYKSTTSLMLLGTATIKDAAGNNATRTLPTPGAAGSLGANKNLKVDGVRPYVLSINRVSPPGQRTGESSVTWGVTFDDMVLASEITTADFTLVDVSGTLTGETKTSTVPTSGQTAYIEVTVSTGSGEGTLRLDLLPAATFHDPAGNEYTATYNSGQTYIIDKTGPTVTSVNRQTPSSEYTNDASVTWRVNFDELIDATTVSTSDFTLVDVDGAISGESVTSVSPTTGTATSILVTANTGTGEGTLRLDVLSAAAISDVAGNDYNTNFTLGSVFRIDKTPPTLGSCIRETPTQQHTQASEVTWLLCFNEPIQIDSVSTSDFTLVDISGSLTGETITAAGPGEGGDATVFFKVTANTGTGTGILRLDTPAAATILDRAGNDLNSTYNIGQTYIIDRTPPTILSINRLTPSGQRTNDGEVTWRITFSEEVDAFTVSSTDLTKVKTGAITGESFTGVNPIEGPSSTVDISMDTGSGDGTIRFSILAAATISDLAGNDYNSNFTSGQSYIIDKTAPTVTINQAPEQADPSNKRPVKFKAVFNEPVTSFKDGDVTLSGTAGATDSVVKDTGDHLNFTVDVTGMSRAGTVIAQIPAGRAVDQAGNSNLASTSTDNQVTFDDIGPTVTINQAAGQADPTRNAPIEFTVVFNEAVSGFTAEDILLSGTAAATTSVVTDTGDHITYMVEVSGMTGDGTVTAAVRAGAVADALGNSSTASTSTDNTVTHDTIGPTVTIDQAAGQDDPSNNSQILFTVVFSEEVADFAGGDVTLTGGAHPAAAVVIDSGDHRTFTVEVSGMTGQGGVIAKLLEGIVHDAAGNANAASTSTDNSVIYDSIGPSVTINKTSSQPDPTKVSTVSFVVVFSESVSDFTAEDVYLEGGAHPTTAIITGSGRNYGVAVRGMSESGEVRARILANAAHDAAGNGNLDSTSTDNMVEYDCDSPTVIIGQGPSQVDPVGSGPIEFRVFFSESVSDFTTGDVTLSGTACATTATVTGSGTSYTVAVTGMSHTGTVTATVASGVAHDAAGNPCRGSTTTDNTVTIELGLENISVSPSDGSLGTSPITISTDYRDTRGRDYIKKAYLLINDSLSQANAVLLYYDCAANRVYLKNDANTSWGTGYAPGTAHTLENSQCVFYVAQTAAFGTGDLCVDWRLALKAPFDAKSLNAYMYVQNDNGTTRGWDRMGIYYNVKPQIVGLVPDDEVLPIDSPISMKTTYRDINGWEDIRRCYLLICENYSQTNAVFLYYDRSNDRLYLKNDANTSWGTGYALGTDVTLENSQCIVYVDEVTPEIIGNDLTLTWAFRLKPGMTGKNLYSWMYTTDMTGAYDGWKKVGTHFTPIPPTCVSVIPNIGNVTTGSPQVFTTTYADDNGYSDIGLCYLQISQTSSQANAAYALYDAKQNKVFLRNDANTAWSAGVAPGTSTTLENGQCILNVGDTTVVPDGTQNLLVNWSITLKPSQIGKLLAERMYCRDNESMNSGWKLMGYVRGQ